MSAERLDSQCFSADFGFLRVCECEAFSVRCCHHSASACWRAERSALLQLDDHLQQRLSTKKMPSWEDLMNCVCMNGGGAQRPGVQEVIDTLQRSSVCTGTQCFETEAE